MSSRAIHVPTEEDVFAVHSLHLADPEEPEADFSSLLTPKLIRQITKQILPEQRQKKGGEKCARMVFKHWLHLKLMQFEAPNPYKVHAHNTLTVPPELLETSPTLADYVDGMVTICTPHAGGVWDVDQKLALLVGVYGVTKPGHLNREEFADLLKKHSIVEPPPPKKKFASEEEEMEYERKVKRGEIQEKRHMTQNEYDLFLYRWLKKSFGTWDRVMDSKNGPHVSLQTAVDAIYDENEKLADNFTINLVELMKDMCERDEREKEALVYETVAQLETKRHREMLAKTDPALYAKLKREEEGGEDLSEFVIPGLGIVKKSGGGGKGKKSGKKKKK
jgi:hypothetical protein